MHARFVRGAECVRWCNTVVRVTAGERWIATAGGAGLALTAGWEGLYAPTQRARNVGA